MSYNRRKFLQQTGIIGSSLLLARNEIFANTKKLKDYGLQLWTVQGDMAKDAKGTLKQVASFGYTQVESFEGSKGMFWGMAPSEFKKYMDGLGMKIVSSHCDIDKDFDKKAADAASIGMKYLICPWKGPQKKIDDFKKIAEEFNAKGDICKKNGIRFGYHNHAYPFPLLDGQIPMDVMIQNTNPATVDFEMDIYWVVSGGADPIKYLTKYKNRWRLCHVKDRIKNADPKNMDASCIAGEGSIDFPTILKVAKQNGVEYYIIEQERFDNSTPLKSSEADAKYMHMLNI